MARDRTSSTRTAAVVGGGALLAWILLRGARGAGGATSAATAAAPPAPCQVRIRARSIELDGAPADLPTTVAACRAAGAASVSATGDAIVGVIAETTRALHAAGVRVDAAPEIRPYVDAAILANP